MAHMIEFETLARFTPTIKWTPDHERGKVIPFTSQRKALYKPVCAAYEDFDSESSRWPDRDEAFYLAALGYAQPLIQEEEPLLADSHDTMAKSSSGSSYWACSPTVTQLVHETRGGITLFNRPILLFLALFLDERHQRYQDASHRTGYRRIKWRKRPGPCFGHAWKDVLASYESLIP